MKKVIIFLSLFILQTILFAQTSVWEVKKDNDIIYLGGTIHLLRSQDYPLPIEFEKAYNHSDTIYFETDLQAMENPGIQSVMISSMKLENNNKLSQILSKKTYEALKKHTKSRGINLIDFEEYKPAMIILTLTVHELKSMGINTQGVDQYFLYYY